MADMQARIDATKDADGRSQPHMNNEVAVNEVFFRRNNGLF